MSTSPESAPLMFFTPSEASVSDTPATFDPAVHDTHELAEQYEHIAESIGVFYLNGPIKPQEENYAFAVDTVLHIKSLCALLRRVQVVPSKDTLMSLAHPIFDLMSLTQEWRSDKVATTRDIHTVANKILDVSTLATLSFTACGLHRQGMRNRLLALFC